MPRKYLLLALVVVAVVTGGIALLQGVGADPEPSTRADSTSLPVSRGAFVRGLRLTGVIESVRYHNVAAPRIVGVTGAGGNSLIITKLAGSGSQVNAGDVLVEFDRQAQLKAAFDKRSEYLDLEEQIRKKRAEHEQVRAKDDMELAVAAHAVDNARLEMRKNELIAKILAEKNTLRMEEAEARLKQLQDTGELKRLAQQA